jgi:hypothetical protein
MSTNLIICDICWEGASSVTETDIGLACADCASGCQVAEEILRAAGVEGVYFKEDACDGQPLSSEQLDALFEVMVELSRAALADGNITAAETWRDAARLLIEAQYQAFLEGQQ